jgi:formylglycine-generating enzyme required for sulfatase activity
LTAGTAGSPSVAADRSTPPSFADRKGPITPLPAPSARQIPDAGLPPSGKPADDNSGLTKSAGETGGQSARDREVAAIEPTVSPAVRSTEKKPDPPAKNDSKTRQGPLFAGNKAGEIREDNGLKTMLSWIPPGSFTMGTAAGRDHRQHEGPVEVTLTNGFWLAKYEVTQAEWQRVTQAAPWHGELYVKEGDNYPATYVSWEDATKFCARLTEQERSAGRLPAGSEYNLPTEAQWEYACRAGTTTPYNFGKAPSELPTNAWFMKNAGGDREEYAHPVGGKNANLWGLHDLHGNVSEWCRDWYAKDLPGGTDPEATAGGSTRVLRGGGWRSTADDCRSAFRNGANPTNRNPAWGFRIALIKTSS